MQVEQMVVHILEHMQDDCSGRKTRHKNSYLKFFLKSENLIKSKIGLDYDKDHNSLIMCSGEQSSSE